MTKTSANMGLITPEASDDTELWDWFETLADGVDVWMGPRCKRSTATAQAVASGTSTQMALETSRYDSGSIGASSGALTVAVAGLYHLEGTLKFAAAATAAGQRRVEIQVANAAGSSVVATANTGGLSALTTDVGTSIDVQLAAGDVVTLWAVHSQGASLNVTYGVLSIRMVAPTL